MTDTELLNALEQQKAQLSDLYQNTDGRWTWHSWSNWPHHRGWTRAESFRDALSRLIETGTQEDARRLRATEVGKGVSAWRKHVDTILTLVYLLIP